MTMMILTLIELASYHTKSERAVWLEWWFDDDQIYNSIIYEYSSNRATVE